jgi:hypothetical protein
VVDAIYKMASINLSPGVPGQIMLGLMCKEPRPGDESYARHVMEKRELLDSLRPVHVLPCLYMPML